MHPHISCFFVLCGSSFTEASPRLIRSRYTVSVDNELFQKIEDFRFEHRYQTRSEATVELIRLGLESLKKERGEGE